MIKPETFPETSRRMRETAPSTIMDNPGETVGMVQGSYYLLTGIWPLVSIGSFMAITGHKTDQWLVKTVGVLVSAIGASIGGAALRKRITREVHLLGVASAAGLAAIDLVYVFRRRISPVYLLDAVAEAGIVVAWVTAWLRRGQGW